MKVKDTIGDIKIGDKFWLEGTVEEIDDSDMPLKAKVQGDTLWLYSYSDISLVEPKQDKPVVKLFDEPQAEKVEVPDFVANLILKYKAKKETLVCSISNLYRESDEYKWYVDNAEIYERAWVNGYTIKPKQWVVKSDWSGSYFFGFQNNELSGLFTVKNRAMAFTDKSKAEAVATLVDGSVEEV